MAPRMLPWYNPALLLSAAVLCSGLLLLAPVVRRRRRAALRWLDVLVILILTFLLMSLAEILLKATRVFPEAAALGEPFEKQFENYAHN
jgi:predicted Na+-dependent transporter